MNHHYRITGFILSVLFLFSCQSIKKSYESRDYDSVIYQFTQSKKKVSDEEINLFIKAYKAALDRDREKITTLKNVNNGERWEQIFDLYTAIEKRQNTVLKVLPVFYSNGSKATVEIFNLSAALEESRENSAQYYYDQGQKLLNSGIKSSIRQSLDYFAASKKFYINYKDVNELMEQALTKGRNYVLLVVEKNPVLMLPQSFEQSILDNVKLTQKDQWVNIDYRQRTDITYDYIVKLNLYDIFVSPESVKEFNTIEDKLIQDGWSYMLDSRGNVMKDSSGNDIKSPKYSKLICQVKETRLNKNVQVFGDATIYEAGTKDFIRSTKCTGNALFDYSFVQISGDRNALSAATLQKLNNPPVPFPNTFELVERSKDELIRCYQDFILNNYSMLTYTK
jgi:hypothetical protein